MAERNRDIIVFEVISGVEGPCLAAGLGEADTRIAGPKPWGGGKVTQAFRVPLDRLLDDLPAVRNAAAKEWKELAKSNNRIHQTTLVEAVKAREALVVVCASHADDCSCAGCSHLDNGWRGQGLEQPSD